MSTKLCVASLSQVPAGPTNLLLVEVWLMRIEHNPKTKYGIQIALQSNTLGSKNPSPERLIELQPDSKDELEPTVKGVHESHNSPQLRPSRDIYDYQQQAKAAVEIEGPICKAVKECRAAFESVLDIEQENVPTWIMTLYGQFNIWAFGINADVTGRQSLDERIKSSTETVDTLLNLLHGVMASLHGYLEIKIQGETASFSPPKKRRTHPKSNKGITEPVTNSDEEQEKESHWKGNLDSSDSGSNKHSAGRDHLVEEMRFNLIDTLQEVRRFTAAVRQSGTRNRFLRADRRFDSTEQIDFREFLVWLLEKEAIMTNIQLEHCADIATVIQTERKTMALTKIQSQLIKLNTLRRHRIVYFTREARRLSSVSALWNTSLDTVEDVKTAPDQPQKTNQHTQITKSSMQKRKESGLNALQPPAAVALMRVIGEIPLS